MNNLLITASANSPEINCNAIENSISIIGESRPENVRSFYEPVFNWLDTYQTALLNAPKTTINLNLNLSYFNSSSVKIFLEIISGFKTLSKKNTNTSFIINWFHDENDEDIIEAGKEFEGIIGMSMCFVVKK